MDKAVRILMGNSEVKTKNTCIRVCKSATQKNMWSNSPTLKWLTHMPKSMVREEWDIAKKLECRCCETGVWFIKKKEQGDSRRDLLNDLGQALFCEDNDADRSPQRGVHPDFPRREESLARNR